MILNLPKLESSLKNHYRLQWDLMNQVLHSRQSETLKDQGIVIVLFICLHFIKRVKYEIRINYLIKIRRFIHKEIESKCMIKSTFRKER